MKTWKKVALAAAVVGASYLGGHVIHHFDKLKAIDRMVVNLPEGSNVLNVGCKNWSWFERKFRHFNVFNIDVVPRDVPNFVLADVRNLSMFEDGVFKGVLCSHVLEHIPREDVGTAIAEMSRVCESPEGIYIVLPRWWLPTTWFDLSHEWIPLGNSMLINPSLTLVRGLTAMVE